SARHFSPRHRKGDFAAQDFFVKFERGFTLPVEIEMWVYFHDCSPFLVSDQWPVTSKPGVQSGILLTTDHSSLLTNHHKLASRWRFQSSSSSSSPPLPFSTS